MIDRDLKEHNAIKHIFPSAKVLVCWFHVLQVDDRTVHIANSLFQSTSDNIKIYCIFIYLNYNCQ